MLELLLGNHLFDGGDVAERGAGGLGHLVDVKEGYQLIGGTRAMGVGHLPDEGQEVTTSGAWWRQVAMGTMVCPVDVFVLGKGRSGTGRHVIMLIEIDRNSIHQYRYLRYFSYQQIYKKMILT